MDSVIVLMVTFCLILTAIQTHENQKDLETRKGS